MKSIYLLLTSVVFCVSQTQIDTLYSIPELDGGISYFEDYDSLFVGATNFLSGAGDSYSVIGEGNIYERTFISFNLSSLKNTSIDSAILYIYQKGSVGNGEGHRFPKWDVVGGDTMFCIADHINIGNELDSTDWSAGDVDDIKTLSSNIGIVSKDSINGYKKLDVTKYVKNDLISSRQYTQYRIRFPILTDFDNHYDLLEFTNGEYKALGGEAISPKLIIKSSLTGVSRNNRGYSFELEQNYPNPFNSETIIEYKIQNASFVSISIYNSLGQQLSTLINGYQMQGSYTVRFDGNQLPSGVYFYHCSADNFQKTLSMTLIK